MPCRAPACGHGTVAGQRFCDQCGAADLAGSMELLADRDPEDARELIDPVLDLMMDAVHVYEGTVNQVMGDGITPSAPATPRCGCRRRSRAKPPA